MIFTKFGKTVRLISAIALAAGLGQGAARADDFYNYAFTGAGVSGSGTVGIVAAGTDGMTYQVTSITGQVNGTAIKGLLQPGVYKNSDNLFFQSASGYVDGQGVSFELDNDAQSQINIYSNGTDEDGDPNYYFQGDETFPLDGGSGPGTNSFRRFAAASSAPTGSNVYLNEFTFSPAAEVATTPEPSGLVLLGTGVLASAGMARRRLMKR